MQDIPLSAIVVTTQQRAQANEAQVNHFCVEGFLDNPLPAIQLTHEDGVYRLLSGVETLLAAEELNAETVRAVLEPRTAQQKRLDVLQALSDPRWSSLSSSTIARYCHVYRELVIQVRAEQGNEPAERTVYRKGRPYAMKVPAPTDIAFKLYDGLYAQADIPEHSVDVLITVGLSITAVEGFVRRFAWHLKQDTGVAYLLFTAKEFTQASVWRSALRAEGFFCDLVVWAVSNSQAGLPASELVLTVGNIPAVLQNCPVLRGPRPATVRNVSELYRKPVWLAERLLKAHERANLIVLDPFMRSPFVFMAAKRARAGQAVGCLLDECFREEVLASMG